MPSRVTSSSTVFSPAPRSWLSPPTLCAKGMWSRVRVCRHCPSQAAGGAPERTRAGAARTADGATHGGPSEGEGDEAEGNAEVQLEAEDAVLVSRGHHDGVSSLSLVRLDDSLLATDV